MDGDDRRGWSDDFVVIMVRNRPCQINCYLCGLVEVDVGISRYSYKIL